MNLAERRPRPGSLADGPMRTYEPTVPPSRAAPALLLVALLAPGLPGGPALALLAAQDGPVTLRLQGRQGDAAVYRFEQDIALQMPPEFGGDQAVGSRLVVEQRVERADEASIRYLAEVRSVSVEMDDSGMAGDLDFSEFEGQRFRMTLSRRGELQEMEPVGEATPGTAQLQQSMRQAGFPVLPVAPVRPGDSWVDTSRVDATAMALPAAGEIVSVHRTTLTRLVSEGTGTVAELAVETSFRFEPAAGAMPGMRVEVTGDRTDAVRFDVTRGRYLASDGSQQFEMTMSIPGATGGLSIRGTATNRTELLPDK